MANKQPTLQERYKRLKAGTWTIYIDWKATTPNGVWHYEQHDPNRNPPHEHWALFMPNLPNASECIEFFESYAGQAIEKHIIGINKGSKK